MAIQEENKRTEPEEGKRMRYLKGILLMVLMLLAGITKADNTQAYRYFYIEAVRQECLKNYIEAFELFRHCLELNPESPEANYGIGVLYQIMNQDSIGMHYIQKAAKLSPDNVEFAERLANTYLYSKDIKKAAEVYESIVSRQPDRTDYLELLLQIYNRNRDYDNMLKTLSRLELQDGQSEEVTLAKMQVYSLKGDQEGAYRELKGLVDSHPHDPNLQVMMGNWLLSNSRKKEALQLFIKVLQEEPDNAQAQMALMDYYRLDGNAAEADKLVYSMLVNPRTEPSTRVTLLKQVVKDNEEAGGDSTRVLSLLNQVLALPQKTAEVAEIKVAYMKLKGMPKDSILGGLDKVLEISPEEVGARMMKIQLLWEDTIDENVIRECRKAVEYVPDEPVLYYYLATALHINKQNDEALRTLQMSARNITKSTPANIASDTYALLGQLYYEKKMMKESYEAMDSCLVHNPNHAMCLNNYAYFLALDKKDLKKAEKMSYRAITAEPNNGTYLDTYAWVLYMEGRYEEACKYIDQALTYDTKDSAILDHAGDIYYKLGRKDDAKEMWRKALDAEGVEDAEALKKKIKEK
jgi:tetratricopeptide (TPR) repeat protein